MNSRMDKYTEAPTLKSRTEKNKSLYDEIKNTNIDKYELNSNATVIEEDYNVIDVDKIRDMLDKRYRETIPKRNIELKKDEEIPEPLHDTKEYDINAILEKAKSKQNIDYEKERLKRVHDTQYDILKKLDIKDNNEDVIEDSEENLVNLINTITALELKNKESKEPSSGNTTALDLLSDLKDNDASTVYKTLEIDKDKIENNAKKEEKDFNIDENYEDFKELEKDLKSNSIAIKIVGVIFVIIILIIAILVLKKFI